MGGAADPAGGRRALYVYSGGFLTGGRVRRILDLARWDIRIGAPGPDDWVGVWGRRPVAARGQAVARATGAGVLSVEDAFLRSLFPGRAGEPTLGLLLDTSGVHYDPATPSDLETLLATHPLDDPALLDRANAAIARLRAAHLTKFAAVDPALAPPPPGYVLVIDQTRDDAAVATSGGGEALRAMLTAARADHPDARILIKTHPETAQGLRPGHFGPGDEDARVSLLSAPLSPWRLFEGATAIYTLSSGLGFEAILAGHRPRVFGQPFYAGWGLTQDDRPLARRQRQLSATQLFAAAMILYPTWYDPYRDRLCGPEEVIEALEAQARVWREDHLGYVASGMRLWKRAHLQRFFGRHEALRFRDPPEAARREAERLKRPLMLWGSAQSGQGAGAVVRIEDGILRSRGLGAALVPPLSLVRDDPGIYYDPGRESRLDRLIAASVTLPPAARARAARVIAQLTDLGLTKYTTGAPDLPDLPQGHRILVPGQVEDDASIVTGCGAVATNAALLAAVRAANPSAVILWKPHPDVEAGLRRGAVDASALALADAVLSGVGAAAALAAADEVWTMTSTLGFEALLRDLPVTCLGTPFYAGWGLTRDLASTPPWRRAGPDLPGLAHAVLIDYPRYVDPVTGLPCPVEVAIERLARDEGPQRGRWLGLVSRLQGLAASRGFWR
ncbi:capsular polysaccharide biosynthesis protein [Palleronia sp. KMU-117]|uniref:capsular polysaccharide biosynthesis protein n=1 Tax=Palleronia sp. KMU-117 TaxID=3434108 RepID=UPI003D702BB3